MTFLQENSKQCFTSNLFTQYRPYTKLVDCRFFVMSLRSFLSSSASYQERSKKSWIDEGTIARKSQRRNVGRFNTFWSTDKMNPKVKVYLGYYSPISVITITIWMLIIHWPFTIGFALRPTITVVWRSIHLIWFDSGFVFWWFINDITCHIRKGMNRPHLSLAKNFTFVLKKTRWQHRSTRIIMFPFEKVYGSRCQMRVGSRLSKLATTCLPTRRSSSRRTWK